MEAPRFHAGASLCVVLVSGGYPGPYERGLPITGIPAASEDAVVFHAGTRLHADGQLLTSGGRVLGVTARGRDVGEARARAYGIVREIHWEGAAHRSDIAFRALEE